MYCHTLSLLHLRGFAQWVQTEPSQSFCNNYKLKDVKRLWFQQDYENFLLEKVRAMPANERDGTFLIRDSSSSHGSKVSTVLLSKWDVLDNLHGNDNCNISEKKTFFLKNAKKLKLNLLLVSVSEFREKTSWTGVQFPCSLKYVDIVPLFPSSTYPGMFPCFLNLWEGLRKLNSISNDTITRTNKRQPWIWSSVRF